MLRDITQTMSKIALDELELIWCFWPVEYELQAADTLTRLDHDHRWKLVENSCPAPDLGSILQYWFMKLQNDYQDRTITFVGSEFIS